MKLLSPEDYQGAVAAHFDTVAAKLRRALPDARIEHVGASSIPGAISKGDLDVCAIVAAAGFDAACEALKALGYVEKRDTLQTNELRMLIPHEETDDHAVQVVAAGSRFEFFIAFRDALRADPSLVAEYNAVKAGAASSGPDGYRAAKAAFIDRVLTGLRSGS